jgi:signal peptidase I
MSTLLLLFLLYLFIQVFTALVLWIAARALKIGAIGYWRALAAVILLGVYGVLVHVGVREIGTSSPGPIGILMKIGVSVGGGCLLFQWILKTSVAKAALAWAALLVPSGAALALVFLLVKPFMVEAFVVPNVAMAPTLIGPHRAGKCPHCEGRVIVPAPDVGRPAFLEAEELGVCATCMRCARVQPASPAVLSADRFLCNKLFAPRRWDVVVLRSLDDPAVKYVKRLVGLPGEEVVIKDGAIWINGSRVAPPAEITQLEFTAAPEIYPGKTSGSAERPARLGSEEYFVVGDFSLRSSDSRTWGMAAGGHQPGSVPHSYIEGVATVIYWPPERWRVLR